MMARDAKRAAEHALLVRSRARAEHERRRRRAARRAARIKRRAETREGRLALRTAAGRRRISRGCANGRASKRFHDMLVAAWLSVTARRRK